MRILIIGKFPPIQGGAAIITQQTALSFAHHGFLVDVISDCDEVEPTMKELLVDINNPCSHKNLTVHLPTPLENFEQFPKSELRTERLIGTAIELCEKMKYNLIVGWYLIPYGFVASAVARKFGIPLVLVHGGSDLMTLSRHKNLKFTIEDLASVASKVVTADSNFVRRKLHKMNIGEEKLLTIKKALPLPKYHSNPDVIALREICNKVRSAVRKSANYNSDLKLKFLAAAKYKRATGPSIIFYGKNGAGKRTRQILLALEKLAASGFEFRVISVFCGRYADVMEDLNFILTSPYLSKRSICLPPVAPWIIPSLLKSCDIGICGESNFGVGGHLSILPREMLNSGLALVTSEDMLRAPFYRWILRSKLNVIAARNDNYFISLRLLLESPSMVSELKLASKHTSRIIESSLEELNPIAAEIEHWLIKDARRIY